MIAAGDSERERAWHALTTTINPCSNYSNNSLPVSPRFSPNLSKRSILRLRASSKLWKGLAKQSYWWKKAVQKKLCRYGRCTSKQPFRPRIEVFSNLFTSDHRFLWSYHLLVKCRHAGDISEQLHCSRAGTTLLERYPIHPECQGWLWCFPSAWEIIKASPDTWVRD
jgi:hypothetical protein